MSRHELQQCINIGEKIAQKLIRVGITNVQKLKNTSTEEIFLRHFEKFGWEKGMCSCYLYALEGAKTQTPWNKIPETRKKELRAFIQKVRKSL